MIRSARTTWLIVGGIALSACVAPPAQNPVSARVQITTTTTPNISNYLLREARTSVFRARTVACLGTGTTFATSRGIVTNRHVASGSTSLQLATWDGRDFTAPLEALATGPDLAVLAGPTPGGSTMPLANDDSPAGTPVWVTGYPQGGQLSVLPGIISDYIDGSTYGVAGQVMEITSAIEPGNSGSPVLNSSGEVVGVAFGIGTADQAGLAIPVSALRTFLSNPGSDIQGSCVL